MRTMSSPTNQAAGAAALFRVDGLVALVTGGGTGIGLMMTRALAHNGAAKVYIAGRRLEVLQAAAESVGPNVVAVQCDVTSTESLQTAVSFITEDAGYLNLLVCNSGIGGPQMKPASPETTVAEWADRHLAVGFDKYVETFAVNAAAVWFTTMSCLRLLDEGNKKGNVAQTSQVVVTSSIAAFNKKAPGGWAYGQSKAAATHAMKQLSLMLPQWDIRANCIAPGWFPSEMSAPLVKLYTRDDGQPGEVPKDLVPLARIGTDEEMGGTMLYLASKAGAYNNGAVIVVDGGRLCTMPSTA